MKGKITSFKFSSLPKISKESIGLSKIFDQGSIDVESINLLLKQCLCGLEPINAQNLRLRLRSVDIKSKELALGFVGDDVIVFGGSISGQDAPFAIIINERSVIDLVYLLLGSKADMPEDKAVLTPVEEGIFSFIISIVFDALQNHIADKIKGQLNLAPLNREIVVDEMFAKESQLLNCVFDLKIEKVSKRIDILIAAQKIVSLLNNNPNVDSSDAWEKGMQRSESYRHPLSVSIGQADIEAEQLRSLNTGDIILLDSQTVAFGENKLSGNATCNALTQNEATFSGQLSVSENGQYNLQVLELRPKQFN